MSNVLQLLQEVDPAISTSVAADLRAVLVAVDQQVKADVASMNWSLNGWWRWLEEDGYNRDTLHATLQGLCISRMGEAAWSELVATCNAHGDDPNGLEWVQTVLTDLDPEFIGLLHRLEAESLLEDAQLAQIAGGTMSKAGKWTLGASMVVGVPTLCYLSYRAGKSRAEKIAATSIAQTNASIHQEAAILDNRALTDALTHPEYFEDKNYADFSFKSAAEYTFNDKLNMSKLAAEKHIAKFAINDYESVIRQDVLDSYTNNPRNLEKVMYESSTADARLLYTNPEHVAQFLASATGKEYIDHGVSFWKSMGWDKLTSAYKQLVDKEVQTAINVETAARAQGKSIVSEEVQMVRVKIDRDAGGFLDEMAQAVLSEAAIEEQAAEDAFVEEERFIKNSEADVREEI